MPCPAPPGQVRPGGASGEEGGAGGAGGGCGGEEGEEEEGAGPEEGRGGRAPHQHGRQCQRQGHAI